MKGVNKIDFGKMNSLVIMGIIIAIIFVFIKIVLPILNTANSILSVPKKAVDYLNRDFDNSLNSMVYQIMINHAKTHFFSPNSKQDLEDLNKIKSATGLSATQKNAIINTWKSSAGKLGMVAARRIVIQDEINRLVKKIGHDFF